MNKYAAFHQELMLSTSVKLVSNYVSQHSNEAELKLQSKVRELISYGVSLNTFAAEMAAWLRATSAGNHARLSMHYDVIKFGSKVDIWHKNIIGDRDRLVVTVTPKESNSQLTQ